MIPTLDSLTTNPAFARFVWAALGFVVIVVGARLLGRAVAARFVDVDSRYRVRKFGDLGSLLLAGAFVAAQYSDAVVGLAAALGVAGAGVAFALQEVIASVAGWVAIGAGGFFRVGDRVQLGGIKGDVIDVGVLRTTLMEVGQWVDGDLYNGRVVRVANSFVFKEPVFNYSAGFPFLWDELKVPVKFGCDAAYVRAALQAIVDAGTRENVEEARVRWAEMVKEFRLEQARLEPLVTLVLTDNWMEFTVRYPVHFQRRRVTKDALFVAILAETERAGPRFALASATFELVGLPPVQVRVGAAEPA